MTLPERLNEDDRYIWDGRKFSSTSRQAFAEALYEDDFERAFRIWFQAAVNESVDGWLPPYRDVEGSVSVDSDVELDENQRVRFRIEFGEREQTRTTAGEQTYLFREVEIGDYSVGFEPLCVVETDEETLETTEYAIDDYTMTTESDTTTVSTDVPIGTTITGGETTLTALTIGDEL